jgi:hypothetical protein
MVPTRIPSQHLQAPRHYATWCLSCNVVHVLIPFTSSSLYVRQYNVKTKFEFVCFDGVYIAVFSLVALATGNILLYSIVGTIYYYTVLLVLL